jgi:hypothetical protein
MEQPMFRLIICCLVLGVSSPAWAVTRYVDSSLSATCSGSTYSIASRNCGGSDGTGYKTAPEAWRAAQHGDLILHRAGSYNTSGYGNSFSDTFGGAGSNWATATTFTNYPGETVTIDGSVNIDSAVNSTSYLIFTADVRGHFIFNSGGLRVNNGVHHIRFERLVIRNFSEMGINGGTGCAPAPSNIEILSNEISNGGTLTNQHHAIYPACSTDWIIRGNYIFGNQAYGIHLNTGSGKTQARPLIEDNWIEGRKSTGTGTAFGLIINFSTDPIIRRNVIVGLGTAAVRYNGCMQIGAGVSNAKVFNNTCYDTATWGVTISSSATNAQVKNNIFNTRLTVPIDDQGPSSVLETNHCEVADTGCSVTGVAGFVTAGTNFALTAGSTAIDAGTNAGLPFKGTAPDIGAFEYGGVPLDTTPPPAPKGVHIQ